MENRFSLVGMPQNCTLRLCRVNELAQEGSARRLSALFSQKVQGYGHTDVEVILVVARKVHEAGQPDIVNKALTRWDVLGQRALDEFGVTQPHLNCESLLRIRRLREGQAGPLGRHNLELPVKRLSRGKISGGEDRAINRSRLKFTEARPHARYVVSWLNA